MPENFSDNAWASSWKNDELSEMGGDEREDEWRHFSRGSNLLDWRSGNNKHGIAEGT